jgi:hypothetical protein
MLRNCRKNTLPNEPLSESRKTPDRSSAAGNFKAHRTRQIALIKAMISFTEMAVFGGGYFPIENDLRRKDNLKAN